MSSLLEWMQSIVLEEAWQQDCETPHVVSVTRKQRQGLLVLGQMMLLSFLFSLGAQHNSWCRAYSDRFLYQVNLSGNAFPGTSQSVPLQCQRTFLTH